MIQLLTRNKTLLAMMLALSATLVLAACAGADGTGGVAGPAGDQGPAGPDGAEGFQGPQGPAGVQGPQGEQGLQGAKGDQGIDPDAGGPPDRTGPSSLFVTPNSITAGETGLRILGAGFAPDISVEVEFHRLFYASSQVIRATPIESSRFVVGTVRANASGAFDLALDGPFPEAVLVYLDELGVGQAVFTVLAVASDGDEASFPVLVQRPAFAAAVADAGGGSQAMIGLQMAAEATSAYMDPAAAVSAGYLATEDCVAIPGVAAMGLHYVNPALMDGVIDPAAPEILLYIPTDDGPKLTGVEYTLPIGAPDAAIPVSPPPAPTIFGQVFEGPMLGHGPGGPPHYDLHVWLWETNANGTFEGFNPALSCPAEAP